MALEPGLDPMEMFEWELGGLRWNAVHEDGDEGLDDIAETEDDAADAGLDGITGGRQRLTARPITINRWFAPPDADGDEAARAVELAAELDALKVVMSPLADRSALRLLRWRRRGEPAKRIAVKPATGKPLTIPGDRRKLLNDRARVVMRLTAPDPVILSDEYHQVTFTAGQTHTIVNAGTFEAVQPIAWWLTSEVPVTIEHLDFTDEWIRFPVGPVTVGRDLSIDAPNAYGLCFGRDSDPFPLWPILRPGANRIRASAPCTFSWRDTW